jgi:predicted nucleic acid-binding protein
MARVALDTQVLIWGVKEEATPGQEVMIARAKRYMEHLSHGGQTVVVPTAVLAELLMRCPIEMHAAVMNLFNQGTDIAAFDPIAVRHFGRLWHARQAALAPLKAANPSATREKLKLDCLIVATALAAKADLICSHDPFVAVFANGEIPVTQIPELPEQIPLDVDEPQQ